LIPLPGRYQIRMVIREDGISQLGSSSSWIEIPDLSKKHLTLSSIFFTGSGGEPPPALTLQKGIDEEDKNFASQLSAKISRRFKRNSNFDFMVFAYNAKTDEKGATDLTVQTQIHAEGKVILATPLKSISYQSESGAKKDADQIGVPYHARLSLESITPGNYELRLVVIDRSSRTSAKRSVKFTIE